MERLQIVRMIMACYFKTTCIDAFTPIEIKQSAYKPRLVCTIKVPVITVRILHGYIRRFESELQKRLSATKTN